MKPEFFPEDSYSMSPEFFPDDTFSTCIELLLRLIGEASHLLRKVMGVSTTLFGDLLEPSLMDMLRRDLRSKLILLEVLILVLPELVSSSFLINSRFGAVILLVGDELLMRIELLKAALLASASTAKFANFSSGIVGSATSEKLGCSIESTFACSLSYISRAFSCGKTRFSDRGLAMLRWEIESGASLSKKSVAWTLSKRVVYLYSSVSCLVETA